MVRLAQVRNQRLRRNPKGGCFALILAFEGGSVCGIGWRIQGHERMELTDLRGDCQMEILNAIGALALPFPEPLRGSPPRPTMSSKTCIICNPGAGKVDDRASLEEKLQQFGNAAVRFTEQEGDAIRFARKAVASGCETVVAAGGDGTLNEVL